MKMKTTGRYGFIVNTIKVLIITIIGKDEEQAELCKISWKFLMDLNLHLLCESAIPFLSSYWIPL